LPFDKFKFDELPFDDLPFDDLQFDDLPFNECTLYRLTVALFYPTIVYLLFGISIYFEPQEILEGETGEQKLDLLALHLLFFPQRHSMALELLIAF
jgi:hypothetical protein